MALTGNPFIDLVLYLLIAAGGIWAIRYILTLSRLPDPPNLIFTIILGVVLLILAFQMSGVHIFR